MLTQNLRVRIPAALFDQFPARRRSAFVRIAIKHYLACQEQRRKTPVAMQDELDALRRICAELRQIGNNLNQFVVLSRIAARGEGEAIRSSEIRHINSEIASYLNHVGTIIRFWSADRELPPPQAPLRVEQEAK